MQLLTSNEEFFLEHQGQKVKLDKKDAYRLKVMTPLGRKVYFRNKGLEIRRESPSDSRAEILISWYRIANEIWAFKVDLEIVL
jgi:hypothetical protein